VPDDLTPEEVAAVTGKRRAASQAAALARLGVPFTFSGRSVSLGRIVAQAHALLPQSQQTKGGVDLSRVK
jgi:hypothetical protein